ncbi:hypothetical protein CQY23_19585 [Mycobacterium celatum]|nr:hypothetical protein CQY23_19585 [Mycobacterium celatum]
MTAPPAWPEADETTLLDAADAFDADRKAVDEQLWAFQQGRTRLFEDDVWSGQAANAAHAKHQQQITTLQAHVNGSAAAAKLYRDSAGVVANTKQQIIENVEKTQQMIEKIANDPQATSEQKNYFIKGLVKETHAENVQLVQAGAAKLGKPPATPLTVRPASNGREVPLAPPGERPSTPVPQDPKEFREHWDKLSQEEKDRLYAQDHSIGNHAGMPFVDRDHYNRMHLAELQKANQAELDRLRAQHPDWAAGKAPGIARLDYIQYTEWKKQWDAANHTHDGYSQVQNELGPPPDKVPPGQLPKYLGIIDDKGHAAVSINNPDTAKRNATFVPGTGQDLARFHGSAEKSERMYWAAREADRTLQAGDVSVTTWMGYDRPMNLLEAASTSYAHNGAAALDDFQAGLRASHNDALTGGPSLNTVIGHSYGSTELGAAALDGHHLDANNVIAVGSPGMLTGHASDLNLDPGAHVFATRAQNDIIDWVTDYTLGPDPTGAGFGAIPFEAAPGPAGPLGLPSVAAHSSYWDPGNPALANMGRIIAGRTDVTPPS